MAILDSGTRHVYDTGACRDIQVGKGRCDLMPLDVVGELLEDPIILNIAMFQTTHYVKYLYRVLHRFSLRYSDIQTMLLEVSIHFEEGALKYGEDNWRKFLPQKCYINSAVRHYLKHLRGDDDERHDRAFVWNIMCLIWTVEHEHELEVPNIENRNSEN